MSETTSEIPEVDEQNATRITHVIVSVGSDRLGYYTTVYGNNERGSRSEGYGNPEDNAGVNLRLAKEAAEADYPDLPVAAQAGVLED